MHLRSTAFACGLVGLMGCPRGPTAAPDERPADLELGADTRTSDSDLRVDPSRCSGDGLDLAALVRAGLCTIPAADARALPEPLVLEAPRKLQVAPGERLDFELI